MADDDLNVVGQWSWGSLQECGETLVTQFHEENGQSCLGIVVGSQVLDHIGVSS